MTFVLPTFNLSVNIFDGGPPYPPVTPRLTVMGNLAFSRRGARSSNFWDQNEWGLLPYLLVPALTDIRDTSWVGALSVGFDVVEVPAGTGRWYQVTSVEDIGKGFANEHRCALLTKIYADLGGTGTYAGLLWPVPMP